VLGNALYLGCTYEALRHMASGVGAIVASLNPLVLALIAPWVLREPLTWLKGVGLALGFGGVLAIMLVRTGTGTADPRDIGIAFFGVLASVAATIVFKRWCGGLDLRSLTALWFWLLTHGDASRVSAYYFLTPVFGLGLAALLLHEPVGVHDLGGLAAIACGIALVQRG
jgi:drug/metabolite transporter (DMT)-like permease